MNWQFPVHITGTRAEISMLLKQGKKCNQNIRKLQCGMTGIKICLVNLIVYFSYFQIKSPLGRWVCNGTLVVGLIVESNLLEIYFIGKVAIAIKKYTKNAAWLLSRKGLEARKR